MPNAGDHRRREAAHAERLAQESEEKRSGSGHEAGYIRERISPEEFIRSEKERLNKLIDARSARVSKMLSQAVLERLKGKVDEMGSERTMQTAGQEATELLQDAIQSVLDELEDDRLVPALTGRGHD